MLSPLDDFPIHQVAEPIRFVGTSDRNFYDRYYFNCFPTSGEVMLIMGIGQYPNLEVQDGFAVALHDGVHRVVRASKHLGPNRMDTEVGPLHIEVIEGLKKLRFICDDNEWGLSFDLTWTGSHHPVLEEGHFVRRMSRVMIDTCRLAQMGSWEGSLEVGGASFDVTPDSWLGSRDRSWGVRPIGEAEPAGATVTLAPQFFWIYAPIRFEDHSIVYICQEDAEGRRILENVVRVDHATGVETFVGRPEHELVYQSGTRHCIGAKLHAGNITIDVEPLLPLHVGVGTGYGYDNDWRHGMYQGPLKVEGLSIDTKTPEGAARMFGLVDNAARFTYDGHVGYGLFETMALGPNPQYGFKDMFDPAP